MGVMCWPVTRACQSRDDLMALTSGTRLGSYVLQAPIGAGGMSEVYRARDTTLRRDVAVKTLHERFARDHDRLARFMREAQTLAALGWRRRT